jgi:hypothetical protein
MQTRTGDHRKSAAGDSAIREDRAGMTNHKNSTGDHTHQEIADAFGLKRQNVQQAEASGLRKIRELLGDDGEDWLPVETRVFRAGRRNRKRILQVRECV